MNDDRWSEARILRELLEGSATERSSALDRLCRDDAEVRKVLEALLELETRANAPMDSESTVAVDLQPAHQIDRYHLLEKVGEGGMGEVWLAEQKEPVRRRVALKVVKAGMNTREVIARFRSERQALALMDHAAIAKVFDAGSTPQGTPYFVMEYVAGVPITAYCDTHKLSTRARLELFMHVCDGVEHAHQKAIIHRDLKPSNILVTEVDSRAAPKIIDFGVAKALTQRLTADTVFTRAGALVGTPEYMSPEQALSSGEDIDTRTDVYSLGLILYELLVGVPPIELGKIAYEEFQRRLREQEPPKPSVKIRTQDPAKSSELARQRQQEPRALAKQMRGDLDSIALKALEKDRSRRYSSVSDLAADIARYLHNEAVLAVPPSVAYRARKFARRYRAALATTAAFGLVLLLAGGVSIRQSIRANREAAVAQAVNDFLQNDLLAQASAATQSGPSARPDPDLKVRTALDRAAVRIAGKFDSAPEVEAAIRDTIGQTYMDLGLYPEARTQLERAVELRRRALGAKNPKTLHSLVSVGRTAQLQGKYADAETLFGGALESQRRVLGPEHPDTLASMNYLGNTYMRQGNYAQAEALLSQTLEIERRVLGPEDPDTLASVNSLASTYLLQGNYAQAEALFSQSLEIKRRVLGPDHPDTLGSMNNLGITYQQQGKYAQAEELYSQSLEIKRRVLGPEHPVTLGSMNNLGFIYTRQGKYAQAEVLLSQTVEIRRRLLGPDHPDTLASMNNLGDTYTQQGKYAQAEALLSQTLEIERRVLGPEHPLTQASMNYLALVNGAGGKYAQAEVLFSQTLEIRRRLKGSEHPDSLETLSGWASVHQRQGKYGEAETYAAQALTGRRHALGSEHPDTIASAVDLALAYLSQGKFAESEPLAREAVEFDRKKQPDDWQRFYAESLLGASLAGQKKYAEAEPLLVEGYQGMLARKDRIAVPNWYRLEQARHGLSNFIRDGPSRRKPPNGGITR